MGWPLCTWASGKKEVKAALLDSWGRGGPLPELHQARRTAWVSWSAACQQTPNGWELAVDRHHPSGVKMRVQEFVWPGDGEIRGGVMLYCQGTSSSLRSLLGHAGMPTAVSSECWAKALRPPSLRLDQSLEAADSRLLSQAIWLAYYKQWLLNSF